jgi:hypothetical protein
VGDFLGYAIVGLIALCHSIFYLVILKDLDREEKLSLRDWVDITGYYDLMN